MIFTVMAIGAVQVTVMVKKILKAKDIEALENTNPVPTGFGLTGTETMGCPTLDGCNKTYSCPTLSTCTTFTGMCQIN